MARKRKQVPVNEVLPSFVALVGRFRPQLRQEALLLSVSFVALLITIALRIVEPWPLKYVFDLIVVPLDAHGAAPDHWFSRLVGEDPEMLLLSLAAVVVLIAALRGVTSYVSATAMAVAMSRVTARIRAMLFSHLQRLSLRFHHKARSGDLVARFTHDVGRMQDAAAKAVLPLLGNLCMVAGMVAVMFWFDVQLALITAAVIPLYLISTLRFSGRIHRVVRDQRRRDGELAARAAESMGAIKAVQAFSLAGVFERNFARSNRKSARSGAAAQRLAARVACHLEILFGVATALVLWRGVHLVMDNVITTGTLVVFMTYLALVYKPLRQSAKHLTQISKALASGERVAAILDTPCEVPVAAGATAAPPLRGAVAFQDVSFSYETGRCALERFSLQLNPGERVALVGPSGAGKSTVISLLLRLYDPAEGRILLDGRDIREFTLESVRDQMSTVLQESLLFSVSIRDNIAFGRPGASDEEVERATAIADADGFIRQLPQGYDTVMGERGATLSGGQRQRIALARAVIRNAPVLLLDEPTSGLDSASRQSVVDALRRCAEGKTTLLVTHDLQAAKDFDRIVYMEGGRVRESGSHAQLMAAAGAYGSLFRRQERAEDNEDSGEARTSGTRSKAAWA